MSIRTNFVSQQYINDKKKEQNTVLILPGVYKMLRKVDSKRCVAYGTTNNLAVSQNTFLQFLQFTL